ncbi:hypothetical protein FSP39_005907 [Pinctada imbricata]|uniref:DOMON domain-containing protein n=1 Tax=Pinctada imbricata TaxID=66713 RepID=A0AA89C5C3_PINIB|nr:hypothetical protein FSP39_005907 [Pinctada imbricata]
MMHLLSQPLLVIFTLLILNHGVLSVSARTLSLDDQGIPTPTQSYPYQEMLDRNGSYFLFWDKNDTHVTMEVHVKTRGYVGFGLSPNGNMFPADIVIGGVKNGKTYFKDRHSTGKSAPPIDDSQDWILLHGEENNFGTVLKFTRKISTCDKQDMGITDATMRVIYSYHDNDPINDTDMSRMYHGPQHRGSKSITFLSKPETVKLPSDAIEVDLLNNNFKMPKVDTRYQCTVFDLKYLGGKHHIVKAIVQPGNEKLVHHAVLNRCTNVDRRYLNTTYDCFKPTYNRTYQCSIIYAWAVGGQDYYFPEDVGFPLQTSQDDELYIMEMHYNNPTLKSDYVDSSGIRIVVTPSLRPIEAGYVDVGAYVKYFQMVPPHEKSFISTTVCPRECISKALTGLKDGITVFSVFQHAHLLARGIKTRLIRNGVELEPIADDNTYDFDFQAVRKVNRTIYDVDVGVRGSKEQEETGVTGEKPPTEAWVGDHLPSHIRPIAESGIRTRDLKGEKRARYHCAYPAGEVSMRYGGISTRDEMCESFMYYYPKTNMTFCISHPVYDTIPVPYSQLQHYFETSDWTNSTDRAEFKEQLSKSKYNAYCDGFDTKVGVFVIIHTTQTFPLSLDPNLAPSPTEEYPYKEIMDPNGNYHLYFNRNDTHVTMEIHVRTHGYVGFGLSNNGKMFPADIVIGWVKDGKTFFKDRHSVEHAVPIVDKSQDWTLLLGFENSFGTILKFTRKIITCDPDDMDITEATMRAIYSYHPDDPQDENSIPYHGFTTRGARSIMLLSKSEEVKLPDDAFAVDFLNDKFEPVVQDGNENLVHHIVVYKCPIDRKFINITYECFDPNYKEARPCAVAYLAWAVGGEAYYFPENIGLPVAEDNDNDLYILQMHYNNPGLRKDYVDSSGMRLMVTRNIRPIEAGEFMTGVYVNPRFQIVPPHEQSFVSTGYCNAECINKGLKYRPEGIHIISVFQHAHLLAKGIKTRLIRKGTELKPLADDQSYDFDFQDVRRVNRTILPGDSIIVECTYNSMDKTQPTYGGESTSEEMCISFFYYYPRIPLSHCNSGPVFDNVPVSYSNILQYFKIYDWTNATRRAEFQNTINTSKHMTSCGGAWGKTIHETKPVIYPTMTYREPPKCKA